MDKSTVEISQKFVTFSECMNFKENLKVLIRLKMLSKIKPHLSQSNQELQVMDIDQNQN